MSALTTKLLRRYFGHENFRGPQEQVIDHLLGDRHAVLVAPTGSGKSICYQIPALVHTNPADLTIVISPLIALMKDQVDGLQFRGIDATFINSSLSPEQRDQRHAGIVANQHRLLYVTPERFRKHFFLQSLAGRRIRLLAVDEAHCVSQWGHDFRPDYSRLGEIRQHLGNPTTLFVTATATATVSTDILAQANLSGDQVAQFHEGIDRPNLSLLVSQVWDENEKVSQIVSAVRRHAGQSGIIYVTLIKTLDRLSDRLRAEGIEHIRYHGQLPRDQRRRVQEQFLDDRCPVVLATNAFGMGIDKPDIRFVIHAEIPTSIEAYYQEIGRAGRDGQPSECLWLYDSDDLMTQMRFIEWRNPDEDFLRRTFHYLTERSEQVRAFGLDWLNERLQRVSRHDHRLETTLALFDRHGVIAGVQPPACFEVLAQLTETLVDPGRIGEKLKADQRRLYALVQFAETDPAHRQQFLRDYFGA